MRRNNLCILIDEAGSRVAFTDKEKARDLKIEYGYVGQLVNQSRGIGSSVARKLELIGNKPENWLDHPHYTKWLELKLISEHEILNDEVLIDFSSVQEVREPIEDYGDDKLEGHNSNSKKILSNDNNEIGQLVKKIEFIFSQQDTDEDIEIIKKIVDLIYNKKQE